MGISSMQVHATAADHGAWEQLLRPNQRTSGHDTSSVCTAATSHARGAQASTTYHAALSCPSSANKAGLMRQAEPRSPHQQTPTCSCNMHGAVSAGPAGTASGHGPRDRPSKAVERVHRGEPAAEGGGRGGRDGVRGGVDALAL
jgi:hypothetical protein